MRLGLDFDDTIHDNHGAKIPGTNMGYPLHGAKDAIQYLVSQGHEVVIFTTRGSEERKAHVEDWLKAQGIPFTKVTNIKENFDLMLDDRAIHFEGWTPELLNKLRGR